MKLYVVDSKLKGPLTLVATVTLCPPHCKYTVVMAMMTRIVAFTLLLEQIPASLHPATNPDPVNINTIICGSKRNFTESKGVIQSPGYPSRYPANVLCTYEINVDYGMRVELTWKDFDVDGAMPDCDTAGGDYVQVYTGYV